MKYWYDLEFIEDGTTIDLISIGIVAEDGREYYAVEAYANEGSTYAKIRRHEWLMDNVVPYLPLVPTMYRPTRGGDLGHFILDQNDPATKPKRQIAAEVRDFLLATDKPIELWAYYGAYDHVCLHQLWGPMAEQPERVPWFTHDIMQACAHLGVDPAALPTCDGTQHHALADARHVKAMWEHLFGGAA